MLFLADLIFYGYLLLIDVIVGILFSRGDEKRNPPLAADPFFAYDQIARSCNYCGSTIFDESNCRNCGAAT